MAELTAPYECQNPHCEIPNATSDYDAFSAGTKKFKAVHGHRFKAGEPWLSTWASTAKGSKTRTFHHAHPEDQKAWEDAQNPAWNKMKKLNPPKTPQNKPMEERRLFHGTPKKIKGNVIKPTKQRGEEWQGAGPTAAFATEDIHEAASHAGPAGHIYEVENEGIGMLGDRGYWHSESPLTIKQEVGFPGQNLPRQKHFDVGSSEGR